MYTIQAKLAVSAQVSITRHISCLWFEVDEVDAAMAGAAALTAEVVLPRHRNPRSGEGGPNHWECWLRGSDGYTVVIARPDGTKG
jgi:hypothetical protein